MSSATPVLAVTVLGDDRPGIVADVTTALAGLGANLEDSTMTLLRGHFAMVVLVRTSTPVEAVQAALAPLTQTGALTVDTRVLAEAALPGAPGVAYTLRVHGADRSGIVAGVTQVIAEHGGNIVDLGTRLGNELYVLVAEVELPPRADPQRLVAALRTVAAHLGVDVSLDPVDDDLL